MKPETRLLYGLGFALSIFGIGYGLVQEYDQLRLGLFLGGFSLMIIVLAAFLNTQVQINTLKQMTVAEIESRRPDLQIASKGTPTTKILSLEHRYPQFAVHSPSDRGTCAKCGLVITLQMRAINHGRRMYHLDCEPDKSADASPESVGV